MADLSERQDKPPNSPRGDRVVVHGDAFEWLAHQPGETLGAKTCVVTSLPDLSELRTDGQAMDPEAYGDWLSDTSAAVSGLWGEMVVAQSESARGYGFCVGERGWTSQSNMQWRCRLSGFWCFVETCRQVTPGP